MMTWQRAAAARRWRCCCWRRRLTPSGGSCSRLAADLRILQEQTQLLQNQLVTLTEALKAVNVRIDEQAGGIRKGFADDKLGTDAMGGDIRVVRERVDDTNVRITSLSQEVEAMREAISAMPMMTRRPIRRRPAACRPIPRPRHARGAAAGWRRPPPHCAARRRRARGPAAPAPGSPTRLYDMAWADYTAGSYDLAIEGFTSYVRSFPRSEFADNAQYYIGESYFQRGRLAEAVEAFGRVISTYPKQRRRRAGVLQARPELRAAQPAGSRPRSLRLPDQDGADSDAGRLAKQRLDALNRARPQ